MKTLLLQISLIIFSSITNAQSWCPAGAEWHYRHSSANSNGFVKLKQTNTVTLQGTSCQQITQTFSVFNSLISSSPTTYSNAIFTTFSNNVVYYYTA